MIELRKIRDLRRIADHLSPGRIEVVWSHARGHFGLPHDILHG
jgi:hypothetical protein